MSTFEKQPGHYDHRPRGIPVWLWFPVLVFSITAIYCHHTTTITVPTLPSNYAVLATDGKGHLFWLEPANSPFPGGKQP